MGAVQQIAVDPAAPDRRIVFDLIDDHDDRATRFAQSTGWTLLAVDYPTVAPLTGHPPAPDSGDGQTA